MVCPNCKKEISDGLRFCPECGAALDGNTPAKKQKKSIVKKWWFWLIVVVLIIVLISLVGKGGSGDNSDEPAVNQPAQSDSAFSPPNDAEPTTVKQKSTDGKIGDYTVTIKDSRVTEDYEGNKILVVTYVFTNNSDKAVSMMLAVKDSLFQNGIELGNTITSYGIDDYNYENYSKDVRPGVSLDVQIAYKLNDETTDVEVEICDIYGFREPLNYTISLK